MRQKLRWALTLKFYFRLFALIIFLYSTYSFCNLYRLKAMHAAGFFFIFIFNINFLTQLISLKLQTTNRKVMKTLHHLTN